MSFRLKCIDDSPNKGKYFIKGDWKGIEWTDDKNKAPIFSADDAYGNFAASMDMLKIIIYPERTENTTQDQIKEFAKIAANDMYQNPSPELIEIFEKGILTP